MATSVTNAGSNNITIADNQFFYEDEVFRFDKKGRIKFGLVMENSGSVSSDDDEDCFDDVLFKGEVRVVWHPDGKEEVLSEEEVGLADRTLMPGDVVRRLVPGKDTQRGYCREIDMRADVRIVGTKYVVKNVVAERLKPLLKMPRDNAVCFDSWVGSTKCVKEKIILKSSCGAMFEVSDLDLFQLKDANYKLRNGIFAETEFYPGQIVTGRIETLENFKLLTPNLTLKTNKKGKPIARKFVVQSVQIEGVWVHWQCKALSEDGPDVKSGILEQPKGYITGEDLERLKRLNLFESCMLQINDKNYLKITDSDVIVKKSKWENDLVVKCKLLWSQQQKVKKEKEKKEKEKEKEKERDENQLTNRNAKNSCSKVEKIKIKLSTSSISSNSQENEKKNSKSLKQLYTSLTKIETHSNAQERNETETNEKKNDIHNNCTENNDINKVDEEFEEEKDKNNINKIKICTNDNPEEWQTDEEEEGDENDDKISLSESATMSSCSSPTPRSSPKLSPLFHKRQMKKLKRNINSRAKMPEVGDEVVTEALVVYSTATVVWQDGTVESGIPSTQLYPIHHLDDHEFFPGDFVLSAVEGSDLSFRDYGVIQTVDHQGRTARVKWFTTYTSSEEPRPTFTGESDVSVYDLKDHPDFQYRPGTIVIRVANFVGVDSSCTAGQIIDNYTDGRVKVWWVDGHISMCWPQDLFEVGQYDPENNYTGNNDSDNDSWETESEVSEPGGNSCSGIQKNLERARVAMARLEEIFILNPNLQSYEVMKKLLSVYKACRYVDRLMNTTFFHEDHFMGLIERVRKGGTQSKAQDQKNRLFKNNSNETQSQPSSNPKLNNSNCSINSFLNNDKNNSKVVESPKENTPKVIINLSSTQTETPIDKISNSNKNTNTDLKILFTSNSSLKYSSSLQTFEQTVLGQDQKQKEINSLDNESNTQESCNKDFKNLNNEKINENNTQAISINNITESGYSDSNSASGSGSHEDFENSSRNEFCDDSQISCASSNNDFMKSYNDILLLSNNSSLPPSSQKPSGNQSPSSLEKTNDTTEPVCAKLCSLLKEQLVKALQEIQKVYVGRENMNLSEVIEYDIPDKVEDSSCCEVLSELEYGIVSVADKISKSKIDNISSEIPSSTDKQTSNTSINNVNENSCTTVIQTVTPESFQVLETAPSSHKFHLTIFHPANSQHYYKAVRCEHKLLRSSLPPGVWVRVFEDRMDLLSVMIEGPKNTPYEDGMFFFDIQLGRDYPNSPPLCHYISYCSDRLNPNLYEDGKVCVSLLGTWSGKDSEVWTTNSTLLQVIVSIQGLILVSEPYFNEAGYEKQKGTQQGQENSRMYNEMVIIKLVQSMTKLLTSPPEIFRKEVIQHFKERGKSMYNRIKSWMEMSQEFQNYDNIKLKNDNYQLPEFPLVPASRGFCLTLSGLLENFNKRIEEILAEEVVNSTETGTETDTNKLIKSTNITE